MGPGRQGVLVVGVLVVERWAEALCDGAHVGEPVRRVRPQHGLEAGAIVRDRMNGAIAELDATATAQGTPR